LPGHRVHTFVDRELFGKSYWRVHRNIDMPYLFMGRKHRALFHDGFSSVLIARKLYPNDPRAAEAALVHVQIDRLCSSDPFFKKQLEFFADRDARERRKAKRSSGKKKRKSAKKGTCVDPLKDFGVFLKKLDEVWRLSKMLFG
jgi:hypothetical protein